MKKYLIMILVILSFGFISNVYAVSSNEKVIASDNPSDTLLCSYQVKKNDKISRLSIYFNDSNDEYKIRYDKQYKKLDNLKDDEYGEKKGSLDRIFSKTGKNVYDEDGKSQDTLHNMKCPNKVYIDPADNQIHFGESKNNYSTYKTFDINKDSLNSDGTVSSGTGSPDATAGLYDSSVDDIIGDNVCSDDNILRGLKIVGLIILLARVLVPLIIIVLASVDFAKAVVNGAPDAELSKKGKTIFYRVIIGAAIFFIFPIISFFADLTGLLPEEYEKCAACVESPTDSCD